MIRPVAMLFRVAIVHRVFNPKLSVCAGITNARGAHSHPIESWILRSANAGTAPKWDHAFSTSHPAKGSETASGAPMAHFHCHVLHHQAAALPDHHPFRLSKSDLISLFFSVLPYLLPTALFLNSRDLGSSGALCVLGDAIGCLIYSFLCLIANSLLVWLIWTHNERKTYIAFIAYFTLIATYSSIIQQLYDYIFWRDLMVEQYFYGKDHADDAEVQYQKGIFGLKLVLSYIRIFAFIVESTLVFFFSFSLTATVYGWWAKKPKTLRILSITGRIVPITLAVISIVLLQLEFTHRSFMVYMAVANAQSFVMLCVFEYTNIGPRLSAKGHVVESAYKPEPDLSHKRALSSVRGYLSGVSPSLLAFVVFGTTKTFQKKMYRTFVPKFLRKGGRDDDDMFTCRNAAQVPSSDYSSTLRASSTILPPPSTANTYVNSPRTLSHQDSNLSIRKLEPTALLSTIPDEPDDFAEEDPRFPRRSQIGMALSKLPTPPEIRDGYATSTPDNGPYSPRTPIYSSIRSPSRTENLPSPRIHTRHESAATTTTPTTTISHHHHSFSRPASRSVDHGPSSRPLTHSHSADLSRGRSRSRSRTRAGGGAFSRDASHDSSSSRVPISRFNNLAGAARGGGPGDGGDDGAGSAAMSMTTIWSDAPRRGSKHSRT
ncbi:glycoside hydrolase [Diaporthe amygdali]|uniref:glycoside hydrolase n=1 Tax=Phomopsis amygdali TaxID=1214568 RepID=UPI0022FF0499|nr:glycoside hydrolase [Diaporthe amygdali]KAJ0114149.1 glycoside hydrolase [Diaporthe amygdali]